MRIGAAIRTAHEQEALEFVAFVVVAGAAIYVIDRASDGAISNFVGRNSGICT